MERAGGKVFATVEDAQAAVDAFVAEYNQDRLRQGIHHAIPADRFHGVDQSWYSRAAVIAAAVRLPDVRERRPGGARIADRHLVGYPRRDPVRRLSILL
jgi:hypothetical protein